MSEKTVVVPNISCGHCVRTIERELTGLNGVAGVTADQATRQVTVSWDESEVSWEAIRDLLVEIRYAPAE